MAGIKPISKMNYFEIFDIGVSDTDLVVSAKYEQLVKKITEENATILQAEPQTNSFIDLATKYKNYSNRVILEQFLCQLNIAYSKINTEEKRKTYYCFLELYDSSLASDIKEVMSYEKKLLYQADILEREKVTIEEQGSLSYYDNLIGEETSISRYIISRRIEDIQFFNSEIFYGSIDPKVFEKLKELENAKKGKDISEGLEEIKAALFSKEHLDAIRMHNGGFLGRISYNDECHYKIPISRACKASMLSATINFQRQQEQEQSQALVR